MFNNEGTYLPIHEFTALDRLRHSAELLLKYLNRNDVDLTGEAPSNVWYNYTFNNPKWQPPIPIEKVGFPIELGLFNLLKDCAQVDATFTNENLNLEERLREITPHLSGLNKDELSDMISRMGLDKPYLMIDSRIHIDDDRIFESKIMAPLFDLRLIDWKDTRRVFSGSFFLSDKDFIQTPYMLSALDFTPMMLARLSTWYLNSLRNSLSITDRRKSSGLPFNKPW